jgi:hypothetical protein
VRGVPWFATTLGGSAAERTFSCLMKRARMSAAGTANEFVNPDRTLAQKGLAFPSKESVYVDARGVENEPRTPFAPSIGSIRGSSW